ncbi:hypothetical protein GQ44DRAFT_729729 [Phaeosphaeriaceae sp. PMI808]|nr:hypothetical protein GQ44DRAFT_729729 [Phaeosphaeriaceae sp. PMI808]
MASYLVPPTAQEKGQVVSKATRRSERIRAAVERDSKSRTDIKKNLSNSRQIRKQAVKAKKRTQELAKSSSIKRPRKRPGTQNPPPQTKPPKQVEKRKRLREEDLPVQKKPGTEREWTQNKSSHDELSEANLRIWEKMNKAASNIRPGTVIQSSSGASAPLYATQETGQTPRSSGSFAFYRFTHLAKVGVYVHVKPPKDIQDAIDAIIKTEPSGNRRKQLKSVSQAFSHGCAEAARAAVGESVFLNNFRAALGAIRPNNLCCRDQADWDEDLKPYILQSDYNLTKFRPTSDHGDRGVNEASKLLPPPKRLTRMSSKSSTLNANGSQGSNSMAPPPVPLRLPRKYSPIKTPRPDLSLGINLGALTSAFSSQGLSNTKFQEFLGVLQNEVEPALISVPSLLATDLTFPFAVVEGKAYSTGRQVFEAENQAAVAGACGLKIQLCLDELVKKVTPSSDNDLTTLEHQPVLFFSICTEGPLHELWAHWTSVESGERQFNMTLLKLCHGVLWEGVEDFMIAVDNVLRWGTGPFTDSVVERLGKLAKEIVLT